MTADAAAAVPAVRKIVGSSPLSSRPDVAPDPDYAWQINLVREDGVQWTYILPTRGFWHLAAEYGIDPGDAATLLDVSIAQITMTDHGFAPSEHDPTFLYHTDEESARLHHLARVKRAQALVRHDDPDGHLDRIRQHHLKTYAAGPGHPHRRAYHAHRERVAELRDRSIRARTRNSDG